MEGDVLYFGYGSNLNHGDWAAWRQARGADSSSMKGVGSAWLLDHSLRFHYHSTGREGGAADVVEDVRGTAVPGAVFSLSEEGWDLMDKKEGHPDHYKRVSVTVVTEDGCVVDAITYTVVPKKYQTVLVPPTRRYAELISDGLNGRNLPIEHLNSAIQNVDSKSRLQHVFVYGTLMRGKSRWPQLKAWSSSQVQQGKVTGRLYNLGSFPGLRLDELGAVHGELHRCEDIEKALEILDQIEGHNPRFPREGLYVRVPVFVQTLERGAWAWTYVINAHPHPSTWLQDGRWTA